MHMATEDEAYWLKQIYELLQHALSGNIFLDYLLPILSLLATTGLAVAAVWISKQSHETAKVATQAAQDANKLAVQFREEEKAQADLAWRRGFAVDLRDWYFTSRMNVLFESEKEDAYKEYAEFLRRADLAGDTTARELAMWLSASLEVLRNISDEERADRMAGKNIMQSLRVNRETIDEWVDDPTVVARVLQQEARLAALVKRAEQSDSPSGPASELQQP